MVRKILTFIALFIIASAAPSFANQKLINGNFENGVFSGWSNLGPNWEGHTAIHYEGMISARNIVADIGQDYYASLCQNFSATPGQAYYATLVAKSNFSALSFGRAGFFMRFLNGTTVIPNSQVQDDIGGLTDWTPLYASRVAPAGTTRVEYCVFVFAPQAETVVGGISFGIQNFFDVAVLSDRFIAPPAAQTALLNSSYENGIDHNYAISFPAAGSLQVDSVNPYQGVYSAKFNLLSTTIPAFAATSQRLRYQGGDVYASAAAKSNINPSSGALGALELQFRNAALVTLGSIQARIQGVNNSWSRLNVNNGNAITPPAGTQWIDVVALSFVAANDSSANGGTVNFDDIVFQYSPLPPNCRTTVLNPSFENSLDNWSQLFGFPATLSSNAYAGINAARKDIRQLVANDYFSQLYQDICFNANGAPFPTGTPVQLAARVSTDYNPVSNLNQNQAGVLLQFINAQGLVIPNTDVSSVRAGVNAYDRVYVEGTTPAGTVRVRASVIDFARQRDAQHGGTALYDAVEFGLGTLTPPAGQYTLFNSDFENGVDRWNFDNKPGELSNSVVHSGNLGLCFTVDSTTIPGPNGQDYFGSASQDIVVRPSSNGYQAKAFAKSQFLPSASEVASLSVTPFQNTPTGPMQTGPAVSDQIGGVTNWTSLSVRQTTIPANTDFLRVTLSVYAAQTNANINDSACFDGAAIRVHR